MTDRIRRVQCQGILERYARLADRRTTWGTEGEPWDGCLVLHDESGVKRLCQGVDNSALRNIGPGFLTWRELYGFLGGMVEAEYLAKDRDPVGV